MTGAVGSRGGEADDSRTRFGCCGTGACCACSDHLRVDVASLEWHATSDVHYHLRGSHRHHGGCRTHLSSVGFNQRGRVTPAPNKLKELAIALFSYLLMGPGVCSEPEAVAVKQSVLGYESMNLLFEDLFST